MDRFFRDALRHITPVTSPLFLISQIQRSGGTLLSQLFDHHSECHTHPSEIFIGHPREEVWPDIGMDMQVGQWWKMLFESKSEVYFKDGYAKYGKANQSGKVFPFIFSTSFQKSIFFKLATKAKNKRQVFDAYMTSYFNAWMNNQNLYNRKKAIIAFVPVLSYYNEQNLELFFQAYPDGKILSIIRNPVSWWSSAHEHRPDRYGDLPKAIKKWNKSTKGILNNKKKYNDQVIVLKFESLVLETERCMGHLCYLLGLGFDDIVLRPTYNGCDIRSDSTYSTGKGILKETANRRNNLTPRHIKYIEQHSVKYDGVFDVY